jgi:DNA-binding Xre family transcriptional regulator
MDPAERISSNTVERTHKDKAYRLGHVLIGVSQKDDPENPFPGAINFWCQKLCNKSMEIWDKDAECLVSIHNPFFPQWWELRASVWTKISKPAVLDIIEGIWADPSQELGGVRGVSKYCSVVCSHACIDIKRKQEVIYDRGELFPNVLLDDPTTICHAANGVNEDAGTLIDIISDDEGLRQPFDLKDLKPILTDIEYAVLCETLIYQKKIRELASEFGMSKSAVDRINQSAKEKAATWIDYLMKAPASVAKAHFCPVFTRASLRPNRISKENVQCWNDALQIVAFHDPASEYQAPVKPTVRVRAKKECRNPDCRNGIAVDKNNLALPANSVSKAVRFLPATTTKNNTLCAGCKAITLATPAKVIEIPVATTLVTITPEPIDAMLASAFYLGENGLQNCNNMEIAYA